MLTAEEKAKVKSYMPTDLAASTRVDIWVDMAVTRVSREYFGSEYLLALCYMASHIGQLEISAETSRKGGAAGVVTNVKEGDVSITYSNGKLETAEDDLDCTIYGLSFKALKGTRRRSPLISGSCL